jgi:hypothetical protein
MMRSQTVASIPTSTRDKDLWKSPWKLEKVAGHLTSSFYFEKECSVDEQATANPIAPVVLRLSSVVPRALLNANAYFTHTGAGNGSEYRRGCLFWNNETGIVSNITRTESRVGRTIIALRLLVCSSASLPVCQSASLSVSATFHQLVKSTFVCCIGSALQH